MVNTQHLEDLIRASGKKKKFLAERCGLTTAGMRLKITNKHAFNVDEVQTLCDELGVTDPVVKEAIFFAK